MKDKDFLLKAIDQAKESVKQGGFPAGAVVVKDGKIIGSGISIGNTLFDPTSHGEIASIRNACANLKTSELSDAVIYTSMEPCFMCFSATMWAGIKKIVFACSKEKVSETYYGGHYHIMTINEQLIHPLELVHMSELENSSLDVVKGWEKVNGIM